MVKMVRHRRLERCVLLSCMAIVLFLAALSAHAQETVELTGIVLDKETMTPLPQAVLYTEDRVYLADGQGHVTAKVKRGERVAFMHLGYYLVRMDVKDTIADKMTVNVLMSVDTIMLAEVTAKPIPAKLETMSEKSIREKEQKERMEANLGNVVQLAMSGACQNDMYSMQKRNADNTFAQLTNNGLLVPKASCALSKIIGFISGIRKKRGKASHATLGRQRARREIIEVRAMEVPDTVEVDGGMLKRGVETGDVE